MSTEKKACDICGKKSATLTGCKNCGHNYCPACKSPSTTQDYCKECVSMEGVVSKK